MRPRLIVLASGSGSTFANLIEASRKFILDFEIQALVTDRDCGAVPMAIENKIPAHVVSYNDNKDTFSERLQTKIEELNPEFIMLAGFLRKIPDKIINAYRGRIYNTHPSLLPEFGGHGMYGMNVHKAVIAAKKTESGVSFHHVTEVYDEGTVIAQTKIAVEPTDTPESLEAKIKNIEKFFVIVQLNAAAVRARRVDGTSLL